MDCKLEVKIEVAREAVMTLIGYYSNLLCDSETSEENKAMYEKHLARLFKCRENFDVPQYVAKIYKQYLPILREICKK